MCVYIHNIHAYTLQSCFCLLSILVHQLIICWNWIILYGDNLHRKKIEIPLTNLTSFCLWGRNSRWCQHLHISAQMHEGCKGWILLLKKKYLVQNAFSCLWKELPKYKLPPQNMQSFYGAAALLDLMLLNKLNHK